MNLIQVFRQYPDQKSCIDFLESIRFTPKAYCPLCGSFDVARKAENDLVGRWNCHDCKGSFNVLSKTIFAKTKIPLQKWFLGIAIVVNAKKSVSSYQLSRDLELNQKSAWFMLQRIRAEMTNKQSDILLEGIVEADETFVGGKPRKRNKREDDDNDTPRGRGSSRKQAVIGAVERGGKVVAEVASDLTGRGVMRFLRKAVYMDSDLITDEYGAYRAARGVFYHYTINHSERYVDGDLHTNTIEGFWSLLKRAWYGTHHHYNKHYTPLYVGEACWKYNNRHETDGGFGQFFRGCFA
ncbi:MAG: IS1595 family transposase [Chloroflexi bacterium]|nr:IS1595 family transposase [Chloroflexota bacterium]